MAKFAGDVGGSTPEDCYSGLSLCLLYLRSSLGRVVDVISCINLVLSLFFCILGALPISGSTSGTVMVLSLDTEDIRTFYSFFYL